MATAQSDDSTNASDTKRCKVTIAYPTERNIPSRKTVQSFFEQALSADSGDQVRLNQAGLLSFEQVILPAICHAETETLKLWQAKVQRDENTQVETVVVCRKLVHDATAAAMKCVHENRKLRQPLEETREAQWQAQKVHDELRKTQEQQEKVELERWKRLQEQKKKLPENQELWREVAYLMTELSKLQKEEKNWKHAETVLTQRQVEMEQYQRETKSTFAAPSSSVEPPTEIVTLQQTIQEIELSAHRMQEALCIVSKIAIDSDTVRQELYNCYRQNHQFRGYQSVQDPKGLVRLLSQSQDA